MVTLMGKMTTGKYVHTTARMLLLLQKTDVTISISGQEQTVCITVWYAEWQVFCLPVEIGYDTRPKDSVEATGNHKRNHTALAKVDSPCAVKVIEVTFNTV